MKRKKHSIVFLVVLACSIMGFVDAIIQPGYVIKSAIKILLFLFSPILYAHFDGECNLKGLLTPKKGVKIAVLSGVGVYAIILSAFLILRDVFDFSAVITSLSSSTGVTKSNFIWVALYISFVNSLLEEFFFRGFAFFTLKDVSSRMFSYIFSSAAFALYHVSMMIGWFGMELTSLAIAGLTTGGILFNLCNEKSGNIYLSWLIHMFANFAINTVGFILFYSV
ncbi:CPBP family intramembrane glutamic endopeptidase [Dysosmobacter acutus]|nr:CPBP family intramembrane glutamic endopeptidase [Dysosmobacter acutus]